MWHKWVWRAKEGTEEEEESKRTCVRLLLSALTPNNYKSTLTYCQTTEKPILSKRRATCCSTEATRQLTVTLFYIHMQANNPSTGSENILFSYSSTNITKVIHTMDITVCRLMKK